MTQSPYSSYPIEPQPSEEYPPPVRQAPWHEIRPVRGLAIAAATVAIGLTVAEVAQALAAWSAQGTYLEAAENGVLGIDVWTMYDVLALPLSVGLVAAYVVGCLWLFRARKNAEFLDPWASHARRRGWVWAGWLVPFVSLWFPFQIVRDVRNAPDATRPRDSLVGWWWTFWLLSLFSDRLGSRLIGFGEIDPNSVSALGAVETVNAALFVVALALWLRLIRGISQDQERAIDGSQAQA